MIDGNSAIIYVGKARDLKRRIASYFSSHPKNAKTQALISQVRNIEITVTRNEIEALVLENQLIKSHQPRYNILLRDDKGYVYIHLNTEQEFPRIGIYHGVPRGPGRFFGPYPSSRAVRETIAILQKLFRLRSCNDQSFLHRSRPCLQYQLKLCDAPCVNLITATQYRNSIHQALLFLAGKDDAVRSEWATRMEVAARELDFEQAARYRDQIAHLRRIQDQQLSNGDGINLDVLGCVVGAGAACVTVLRLRGGYHRGHYSYFPHLPGDLTPAEVLTAFLPQYYLGRDEFPQHVLVNAPLGDCAALAAALTERSGQNVAIFHEYPKSWGKSLLNMATQTAEQALALRQASRETHALRLQYLTTALGLTEQLQRLECFDVSHTHGAATVAACVVMGRDGLLPREYRRFNIQGVTPGDDYAALRIALTRRYQAVTTTLPQVLIVDGGRGQMAVAAQVIAELHLEGICLIGVAKGPDRTPGSETILLAGGPLHLAKDAPARHLIQEIRDAAHHFAITGHRTRRDRLRRVSILEGIPGIGPQRRRVLLNHFGGLQEVKTAGIDDLARVPGISRNLAEKIYEFLHP